MRYEYKVVPAPRQPAKMRGRMGSGERFAMTLAGVINEAAAEGWEYVRADSLPCETRTGLWRRAVETEQHVLVFRRALEAADRQPRPARAEAQPPLRTEPLRAAPSEPPRAAAIGPATREAPQRVVTAPGPSKT